MRSLIELLETKDIVPDTKFKKQIEKAIKYLEPKKKILLLTTSNRGEYAIKDPEKNPSGHLRCWASFNNPDDELWKITTPLFEAQAVVFLGIN